MSYLGTKDFGLEVARQNVAGQAGWTIPGARDAIDTANYQDLTGTGHDTLPRPAGTNIEIVSSSANDTSGGTGVRAVDIEYLDSNR